MFDRDVVVVCAPSNLGLMPPPYGGEPGVRGMAEALVGFGLLERLGARDGGVVEPPAYVPERDGETGVRNVAGVRSYTVRLADALGPLMTGADFALVVGGDCSILLGCMLALRRKGAYGLIFIDAHADFLTPETSATGGAAGMDLALATGRGPQSLTRFEEYEALVQDEAVVVMGHQAGQEEVAAAGIRQMTLADVRRRGLQVAATEALAVMQQAGVEGFWIHLDVDVLNPELMPAVDSPAPDGLQYEELSRLLRPLLRHPLAVGMDMTIYDPLRDEGGEAGRRLVEWMGMG